MNRPITHLRHVDLAVPHFGVEREFLTSTWRLTEVGKDSNLVYLATEASPEAYVLRLRESTQKRIDLIAFGAEDRDAVDTLAETLMRAEVRMVHEPRKLATLGGGYGFRFFDDDGRTLEVSTDVDRRKHRKIEKGESIPRRLSHVVLNSPDPEATVDFYQRHLGFALSDTLTHPRMGPVMWFLRCNEAHHSVAIARGPHVSLHHISFEMRGIDEFMRGTGRLIRAGAEKVWGPGRHLAGNNTFSYFLDPNGNTLEYTTELETVDEDNWRPHLYDFSQPDVSDQWGTANPIDEIVARKSFNDPDRGSFVAPPI